MAAVCFGLTMILVNMVFQPYYFMLQRAEWAGEVSAHEKLMEDHEAQRVTHLKEQQEWMAEKAQMDQWKADLEDKRQKISWTDHSDRGCSKYSKRAHTATLSNVPAGLDPRKECELKPLYINHQWVTPSWCEDPVRLVHCLIHAPYSMIYI